jgi:xylose isomerase
MDTFARALLVAEAMLKESSYLTPAGNAMLPSTTVKAKDFENGLLSLEDMRQLAKEFGEPDMISGKQGTL